MLRFCLCGLAWSLAFLLLERFKIVKQYEIVAGWIYSKFHTQR